MSTDHGVAHLLERVGMLRWVDQRCRIIDEPTTGEHG